VSGIPEPWGTVLNLVLGPLGAVVVLCLVIYFLWKLYREATAEAKKAQDNVSALTTGLNQLTATTAAAQSSAVSVVEREAAINRELIKELLEEVRSWRRERGRG
jgi:hypothetical protein